MTSKLRVEMVAAAPGVGVIGTLLASQTVSVTSPAIVSSEVMPASPIGTFAAVALLSGVSGAVVATWDGTAPSDANGIRIAVGDHRRVILPAGNVVKCAESVDQP